MRRYSPHRRPRCCGDWMCRMNQCTHNCNQGRLCPRNLHRQPCVTPWECGLNTEDGGEKVDLGGGNVFLTELTEVPSKAGYLLWIGVCFVALAFGYAVML